jgi:CO dehydrogenase maturation factor
VFAVDGDSNNCLGYTLGFPHEQLERIRPLSEMREELEKRSQPQGEGMFLLAPPVGDLIERYALRRGDLSLLVMGTIEQGGGGCACPLNTTLREVLRQMVKRPEAIVVDMEAGLEHLGRGTAAALDTMILVCEPTQASIRTSHRIASLATNLGVSNLGIVGNKIHHPGDEELITQSAENIPVLGMLPYIEHMPENLADGSDEAVRLITLAESIVNCLHQT